MQKIFLEKLVGKKILITTLNGEKKEGVIEDISDDVVMFRYWHTHCRIYFGTNFIVCVDPN